MSADWQVGDLALCIDNSPHPRENMAPQLQIGQIYRVAALGVPEGASWFCLAFRDFVKSNRRAAAFRAQRFRKIRPDAHEGEREDWNLLLETHRSKAPKRIGETA